MNTSSPSANTADLLKKIQDVRICMFTTADFIGNLTSHPMTLQEADQDGTLWFFTSDTTAVARDIGAHPMVNLAFSKPGDSLYVSVSGRATAVRDQAKIQALWNAIAAAWFPGGVDDPHLTLVKVEADSAEYWDSNSSKMVQLFKMAKAALTGETPKVEPGEHGKVTL